jgi:trehalose 6-phosphate synthase
MEKSTVRLALRFVVPLLVALSAFAWAAVLLTDVLMTRWFVRDLEIRSSLIAATIQAPLDAMLMTGSESALPTFFDKLAHDERLYAVGLCQAPYLAAPVSSSNFPPELMNCDDWARAGGETSKTVRTARGTLNVAVRPIALTTGDGARLVVVHDMNFVDRRSEETRRYLFYFFLALGACVALITVTIVQVSWRGWVSGLRALLRGDGTVRHSGAETAPELRPIARDVTQLLRELEHIYRPTDDNQQRWNPETLRATLRGELRGNDIIVVSNREPYIHDRVGDAIQVRRPASGLVTALEPVMRACSGTWIAQGSGSADRETVDRYDRVAVPPGRPTYRIRRIWLSPDEETGFYSGFANEGLWPLCHIAHVRPTFRMRDWEYYQLVNARFADAVVREATSDDPIVLVQDYHFALLPRMIRERLPNATIISFWHIPWPNPEVFAICPWRKDILEGLLGSSILGFHTQYHCNNFLDTVDRFLEARVDRERFNVTYRGEVTAVHAYPISIEWPPEPLATAKAVPAARDDVRARLGLPRTHKLGVGIERLDYTKGIIERFNAVERLLEKHPQWIGQVTFVQIASPSRGTIGEYRVYSERVDARARAINAQFADADTPPIILLVEHHSQEAVYEYHRAADFCFVSSLHDGMNLVAKEFVAARDDEQGVLILSQFAGASRELSEALIVNPYDADQCALALQTALTMSPDEQRDRMRLMRSVVREFNVYRWAGRMLLDASAMRQRRRFTTATTAETRSLVR